MEPFLLVVAVAVAAALLYASHHRRVKRREAIAGLAFGHGLSFAHRDVLGLGRMPMAFLHRGDDRGVENVVYGTLEGRPIRIFDLWVMHESVDAKGHRSRRFERYTCASTEIPGVWWPAITIKGETFATRIGDAFGKRDLQFESEDFNAHWDVRSRDPRCAYALVDARMMQWLLMAGADFRFEVSGPYLMVVTDRLDPASWMTLSRVLDQFRDRIPAVAHELYRADA